MYKETKTPQHEELPKEHHPVLEPNGDGSYEGLPQFIKEALETPDDAPAPALIIPYMGNDFLNWLIEHRHYHKKRAKTILSAYETAYEKLNDVLHIDLYDGLRVLFPKEGNANHGYEVANEFAVDLVAVYVEMMEEELQNEPKSFSSTEQQAIFAYHDFISWTGGIPEKYAKKEWSLPFAKEFREWITPKCDDALKAYINSVKAVSSVKCLGRHLDSVGELWEELMHEFAETKDNDCRKELEERIKKIVCDAKEALPLKSRKSVRNGSTNLDKYFLFINHKYKTINNEKRGI